MRILIATSIYPPQAGGPSYYAKSLKDEFEKMGHTVVVRTYGIEYRLPSWIKHLVYFLKTIPAYLKSDIVILLDTMIVGFPIAMIKFFFGGVVILRTGGDFLWEHYVERRGEKILFSKFYDEPRRFTLKEKIVFMVTRFVLKTVSHIVFSTTYQRDVWMKPYGLDAQHVRIIENSYDLVPTPVVPAKKKEFVSISRDLKLKNIELLRKAFDIARRTVPDISLFVSHNMPRKVLLEKLKDAYATVVVSLSEISPNFVIEGLAAGKPSIVTRENGILHRIGPAVIAVDPTDANEIASAIINMANDDVYHLHQEAIATLSFQRPYSVIAAEFLELAAKIS